MEKDYSYTIGITTPLLATDKLHKGDYIYEIDPQSEQLFEKVWYVLSIEGDSKYNCVSLGDGTCNTFDFLKDDLTNLQKLQLSDAIRKKLNIQ